MLSYTTALYLALRKISPKTVSLFLFLHFSQFPPAQASISTRAYQAPSEKSAAPCKKAPRLFRGASYFCTFFFLKV